METLIKVIIDADDDERPFRFKDEWLTRQQFGWKMDDILANFHGMASLIGRDMVLEIGIRPRLEDEI